MTWTIIVHQKILLQSGPKHVLYFLIAVSFFNVVQLMLYQYSKQKAILPR
jgi:hypothetical protein